MSDRHASWEEILDFVEKPEGVTAAIREHLRECSSCAGLLEEARVLLESLNQARLPQPPRSLLEKTWGEIAARLEPAPAVATDPQGERGIRQTLRRAEDLLREIQAVLVSDSLRPSPALRGDTVATPRTLLYETDDYSIALSLSADAPGSALEIMGQVAPKRGASLPADGRAAVGDDPAATEAPVSELGQFSFSGLDPEVRELSLTLGDARVRLRIPAVSGA